jgi:hypothetical protein
MPRRKEDLIETKNRYTRRELEQFFAAIGPCLKLTKPSPYRLSQLELQQFFSAISIPIARAEEHQRQLDRKEATRFNVFDLIEPDENKLSDILKDLLDPNGGHGQGDLFLCLLLERLGFGSHLQRIAEAAVYREAPTYAISNQRRRIDIVVETGVLLGIENKKDSPEQEKQVKDYLEHLARCANASRQPHVLIYLTLDRHLPASLNASEIKTAQAERRLRCWSYQRELQEWLEDCRQQCQAQKIQHFLDDFIAYIATVLRREKQPDQEEQNNEH